MKTGWKVVLIVVAVAILLGAVCVGVGFMTGGSVERILPAVNDTLEMKWGFGLDMITENYQMMLSELLAMLNF